MRNFWSKWSPLQATGVPDTLIPGDYGTAWAASQPDVAGDWLELSYPSAIVPRSVKVYESYNPGAVSRITAFKADGEEVEVWKGTDPTPTDAGLGVSEIPVKVNFKTNRVKIYLDSGWPDDNFEPTQSMRDLLAQRGYQMGADLCYYAFPGAEHDERSWATRCHLPFQFFWDKTPQFT